MTKTRNNEFKMRTKMNKNIIVIALLAIALIPPILFVIKVTNNDFLSDTRNCSIDKIDKVDTILFKKTELENLKSNYVMKFNFRNDIKCYKYKNINNLYITKLNLSKDTILKKLMSFREEVSSQSSIIHSYEIFSNKGVYDFLFLREKMIAVNKIIFSLKGKFKQQKKYIYNKNFVSYYLPVSTFSLRYGEDAPTDIFFGGKETLLGRGTYPLMISFYKIHKSLYVLILIPDKNEMNLEGDLFGKIMNDNSMD
jgi:hypothetical protein